MSQSIPSHKFSPNPQLPDFVALAEKLQETAQALLAACQNQEEHDDTDEWEVCPESLLTTSNRRLKFALTKFQVTRCGMSKTCSKKPTLTTCTTF